MKSAAHDTRYGKNPFACKRLHGFSAKGAAPRGGRLGWVVAKCPAGLAGLAGRCRGAGHAVNPSMGARRRHPWRLRSRPLPRPASGTFRRFRPPRKEKGEQEQKQHSGMFRCQVPTPRRSDRCVDQGRHLPEAARTHRHRETVGGGAVWVGSAMDGAIGPPWVRALCLRSTASQAPERTAASGWAGPRRGVYGVSCQPTPARPTSNNPEPLWLWLWLLQVQGAALPNTLPLRSPGTARRYPK